FQPTPARPAILLLWFLAFAGLRNILAYAVFYLLWGWRGSNRSGGKKYEIAMAEIDVAGSRRSRGERTTHSRRATKLQ
ncbi:MAG: hypothetical protein ACREF4_22335, partial [Gammaproteobacteria bacterium]